MKKTIVIHFVLLFCCTSIIGQNFNDFLPTSFHKQRRAIFREKMPKNTIAVFFANPIRNRSNDVNYVFHQDPNFYYLTGFREPNAVLIIYSDEQTGKNGETFNETLYVPKKDKQYELWNGQRLGVAGVKEKLGFQNVKQSEKFLTDTINYQNFNKVFLTKITDDFRDISSETTDTYDLVKIFKNKANYNSSAILSNGQQQLYELIKATPIENFANVAQVIGKAITRYPNLQQDNILMGYAKSKTNKEIASFQEKATQKLHLKTNIDLQFLPMLMATLREVKTPEEIKLLTKAIRISAIGQIEVMKAIQPHMSEREIQGIHEFVYKRYGAEYEGYPSIVGAGNNGCYLHYIDNHKQHAENELVLMDLGAEYRGYTADVTRTIPANGKFSEAQKAIYNIVLEAQSKGIAACKVGNPFWAAGKIAKEIINQRLFELGIIHSTDAKHNYFPHGTSHHIGLDVHDPGTYGLLSENMIITVEPGIYIPKGSNCDKKWWGIAIRIEDDILITKQGPKNLSEEAPRTIEAIEKMMRKTSILKDWVLPDLD